MRVDLRMALCAAGVFFFGAGEVLFFGAGEDFFFEDVGFFAGGDVFLIGDVDFFGDVGTFDEIYFFGDVGTFADVGSFGDVGDSSDFLRSSSEPSKHSVGGLYDVSALFNPRVAEAEGDLHGHDCTSVRKPLTSVLCG